mgnify:CR=1 FL=1
MKLEIVSPDGILFEGEAERVSFPGRQGTIQYEHDGKKGEQAIKSGFVEVKDDYISVCIE